MSKSQQLCKSRAVAVLLGGSGVVPIGPKLPQRCALLYAPVVWRSNAGASRYPMEVRND